MNRNWKISQYCENPPKYDLSNYQDVCANYTDGEVTAMALCAGASTGMHSHIGASCIAEFSAKYFAEHFDAFYNAEFNTACAELTNYHQAMISHLAGVAFERKNVQILVGRTIQIKELNKFACGVQVLAVKDDKAVYFKIGNGSAAVVSDGSLLTLSDSVPQPTDVSITTPNPIFVLINCDFKTFTLSPSCNAISLATDGVEFENGLFFEHNATPFYQKLLEDICNPESDPEEELRQAVIVLFKDNMNTEKDNIGISVMYREPLAEEEREASVEMPAEEIPEEDEIPLVEIDEDIIETIPVSEIIEETPVEEVEEIVEEAPVEEAAEIIEETPVEEAAEIVEEVPVEEAAEIIEEAPVEETEEIVEEAPVEETEAIVEDEPVEEAAEIIEEAPVEEAAEIIEETPAEEAEAIIEEAPVEEAEAIIEEAPVEEAEAIVEEAPAEETEAIVEEAPVEEAEAIIEETPVEEAEAIIEEAPAEETEAIVEEEPVEEAAEIIEEAPAEETEAIVEEAPVEEAEAIVEEAPVEKTAEIIEEVPVEEAEAIIEEAPVEEAAEIIEETPVEETAEIIEEVPVEEREDIIEEAPTEETEAIIEEAPVEEAEAIIEEAPVEEAAEIIEETPVEETAEIIEETPVEETPNNDFETSFFPEEDEESVETEMTEKKPKFSVKTDKMKASIGSKTVSEEKPVKKSSKLFKFFNISVSKK